MLSRDVFWCGKFMSIYRYSYRSQRGDGMVPKANARLSTLVKAGLRLHAQGVRDAMLASFLCH